MVLQVFGLLVLFAGFFSAVLLTVTSFARSFKEAQAYLIPLMLLAIAPGLLSLNENLKLSDSVPLEPWLAKVDSSGNLLWQHLYYQTNKSTGRPLSEYFAASAAASDGGFFSLGFTENATNGQGELFPVKTDSTGVASSTCTDLHPATTLNPTNPSLTAATPSLPVSSTVTPVSGSPATTVATSISTQSDC